MDKDCARVLLAILGLVFVLVWGLLFSVGYLYSSEWEWDFNANETTCTVLAHSSQRNTCQVCSIFESMPSTAVCVKGACCDYPCWDVYAEVATSSGAAAVVQIGANQYQASTALDQAVLDYPLGVELPCWQRLSNASNVCLERSHGHVIALAVIGSLFVVLAALLAWHCCVSGALRGLKNAGAGDAEAQALPRR